MWIHHNKKQKKQIIIAIAILAVLLILLLLLKSCGTTPSTPTDSTQPTTQPDKTLDFIPAVEKGSIVIPGFTGIYLVPGQLNQSVNFSNPEVNNCYFVLALYLSDETKIWESDYIAPGQTITDITLLQELQRGLYKNCILHYRCFSLDSKTELNGSTQRIEINTN